MFFLNLDCQGDQGPVTSFGSNGTKWLIMELLQNHSSNFYSHSLIFVQNFVSVHFQSNISSFWAYRLVPSDQFWAKLGPKGLFWNNFKTIHLISKISVELEYFLIHSSNFNNEPFVLLRILLYQIYSLSFLKSWLRKVTAVQKEILGRLDPMLSGSYFEFFSHTYFSYFQVYGKYTEDGRSF